MNLLEIINDRGAAVSSVSTAVINAGHDLKKMSDETLTRTVAALRLAAGKVFLSEHDGEALVTRSVYNLPADDPGLARRRRSLCQRAARPSCCKTWPPLPGRTTSCSGWPSAAWARWWPCR